MTVKIIDSHMHCGVQNVDQSYELVKSYLHEGGIEGACLYAPVEDIYDRYKYYFEDTPEWIECRQRANRYLLNLQKEHRHVFAYYFVWNDFRAEELKEGYKGIKWHRHESEPEYHYDDPLCEDFLQEVYRLQLPVVLEESFTNTLAFVERVDGQTPIIIPHLGSLNGGFRTLLKAGVWDRNNLYADTALASGREILTFLEKYGSERLLFGSDFPFGIPSSELLTITKLHLPENEYENIVSRNILRLMKTT